MKHRIPLEPCRLIYYHIRRPRANVVLEGLVEKGIAERVINVSVFYRLVNKDQVETLVEDEVKRIILRLEMRAKKEG